MYTIQPKNFARQKISQPCYLSIAEILNFAKGRHRHCVIINTQQNVHAIKKFAHGSMWGGGDKNFLQTKISSYTSTWWYIHGSEGQLVCRAWWVCRWLPLWSPGREGEGESHYQQRNTWTSSHLWLSRWRGEEREREKYISLVYMYRISSKSRRTSKSHRPRNVAASICQLIPINAALEISPNGKGSTAISGCAHAFYLHTNRFVIEAVYARACRSL